MVISLCCKDKVYTTCANEGIMYYMCYKCDCSCETMFLAEEDEGTHYDTGREAEAKAITDQP